MVLQKGACIPELSVLKLLLHLVYLVFYGKKQCDKSKPYLGGIQEFDAAVYVKGLNARKLNAHVQLGCFVDYDMRHVVKTNLKTIPQLKRKTQNYQILYLSHQFLIQQLKSITKMKTCNNMDEDTGQESRKEHTEI